jgi:hypothetical protein
MKTIEVLHAVWAWMVANPAYSWPLISALIVSMLKPRTPEQYAKLAGKSPLWFWARWAAFLQLVGALGIDPAKALEAASKAIWGRQRGPGGNFPPPPAAPVLLLVMALGVGTSGCQWFTAKNIKTVLSFVQVACIIEHATLADVTVAKMCDVADDMMPSLQDILSKQRTALAAAKAEGERAARAGMVGDAGVEGGAR